MLKPVVFEKDLDTQSVNSLKTNINIWVINATSTFKAHIEAELSNCININVEWLDLSKVVTTSLANMKTPDVIYIEAGDGWAQKIAHIYSSEESLQRNQTALVVFGDENDTSSLKLALKLGASDYFSREVGFSELFPILQDIAEEKVSTKTIGALSLFINTKGGSGATTVALNTAIALSEYSQGKVLLIDLDMQFSDAADYLNSKPKYSINDVVDSINDLDEMSLEGLVYQHASGVNYLCFNQDNIKDNYERATEVNALIPLLRQYYQHIIVDMSHGVEHVFQHLVAPATSVYLVMQQNVTSIKHAANYVKSLQFDYGLSSNQIKLIINRFEKKAPISIKDIEETFPKQARFLVPNNFAIAIECANLGKPIVQAKKKSAIKSSLIEISHQLEQPANEKKQSWLSKFFS
ncbi:AAA family ATPase [Vibrio sp. PID23_8]|uniref:AAA family ATPase n=1 Tax=Vibrio sp. PID23_8 TaxID=1583767 RepID=UPI000E6A83CD|nr:AAA family ATPase [Vibrio sp. PID23_8]RIZ57065.1 type II secretion protein [Vibrio sp. PID23_8]